MQEVFHALGIEPQLILINIIGFVLLFWLLRTFLFGPIRGILAQRQAEIHSTLEHIQEDRHAMEETRADYERRLANIEAEARERIQAAVKEAHGLRDQIIQDARTESERISQRAQQEIEREKQKALVELRAEVADLAVAAAGKILRRSLDTRAHQDLLQEFVAQVGEPPGTSGPGPTPPA
ncbi:MAG: F0F1 ATP synthase subunit B [Armatimonadetes bacterium]|nr:F0F1 ATP synthase subunit B [Armatimonadota bacterium]